MVEVEGCPIEMLTWGDPGAQGLLLVHGAMAHALWWSPVAQLLARKYRVTALSLAGMGDSGWRERYGVRLMAKEVWGAAEASGLLGGGRRPALVAHSFGGKPAALVAAEHGRKLLGTILVDSQMRPDKIGKGPIAYRERHYDSEIEAIARFRLAPDQPPGPLYLLDELARNSIRQEGDRWTWKFDPGVFNRLVYEDGWKEARQALCPLAFINGSESSLVMERDLALQKQAMPAGTPFVEIPDAHHHVMLDQPIALAAAISALVEVWRTRGIL